MHGPGRDAHAARRNGLDHNAVTVVLRSDTLASLRGAPTEASADGGSTERRVLGRAVSSLANRVRETTRSDRSLGLVLVVAIAVAALAATLAGVGGPVVRAIFALPLVVAAPGYAVIAAACPGPSVSGAERLALSMGASLAATVVGGLLLHWTPWGLRADTWVVLLGGLTLVAAAVAFARRRPEPVAASGIPRRTTTSAGLGRGSALLMAVAGLIIAATVQVARIGAAGQAHAGFTQVWMLPNEDTGQPAIRLGVHNQEGSETSYRLQLDIDGAPLANWPAIVLASGETWEATAVLPAPPDHVTVAEARLYRTDGSADASGADAPGTAYRRVMLRR